MASLPGSQASTIFLLLYDGLLWRTLLILHLRMESASDSYLFGIPVVAVDDVVQPAGQCCSMRLHRRWSDNIPVDPDYILPRSLAGAGLHNLAEDILRHS